MQEMTERKRQKSSIILLVGAKVLIFLNSLVIFEIQDT